MAITKILRKTPDIHPLKHIRVVDGDTIEADIILPFDTVVRKRIRIRGWWADELDGPYRSDALEAARRLEEFCKISVIWLHAPSCRLDRYGRALGHLMVGERVVEARDILRELQLTEMEHKRRKDMAKIERKRASAWPNDKPSMAEPLSDETPYADDYSPR